MKRCQQEKVQQTWEGTRAFDAAKDCIVCKSILYGGKPAHRSHYKLCPKNRKTKGGIVTDAQITFDAGLAHYQKIAS